MYITVLSRHSYYETKYRVMSDIKESFRGLEHGIENTLFSGFNCIEMYYRYIYSNKSFNHIKAYDYAINLIDEHINSSEDRIDPMIPELYNPSHLWTVIIQNIKILGDAPIKIPTVLHVYGKTEYEAYLNLVGCKNIDDLFIEHELIENDLFTKHVYIIKSIFPLMNPEVDGIYLNKFKTTDVLVDVNPFTFLKKLIGYNPVLF